MTTAFGLDLAGYSTGKTGFARADYVAPGQIQPVLYRMHPFARKLKERDALVQQVAAERDIVQACLQRGTLLVDIPIDLQDLPAPEDAMFIWQLVKRPVDFALGAMPALADRIGAPAARFRHVLLPLQRARPDMLGTVLFETYPAATLKWLDLPAGGYKPGYASFQAGTWQPVPAAQNRQQIRNVTLARLLNGLTMTAKEGTSINDDECDALICAITGAVPEQYRLHHTELQQFVIDYIRQHSPSVPPIDHSHLRFRLPDGYVLLKQWPDVPITLTIGEIDLLSDILREIAR